MLGILFGLEKIQMCDYRMQMGTLYSNIIFCWGDVGNFLGAWLSFGHVGDMGYLMRMAEAWPR